ncbi:hypothetical protein LY78DRAFT_497021 [Colletotrichum sublineola]|nr:hypothetical protein LY78DRAFT_497021 [Colletotrichum sublineola]
MVLADDGRVVGVNCSSRAEALEDSLFLKRGTHLVDLQGTAVSDLKYNLGFQTALSTVLRWMELERVDLAQPLRQLSTADTALART